MGLSYSKLDDTGEDPDQTLERRRMFHGLARSLEGGNSIRPGLPVELVIDILRLADCTLPCRRLSVSTDRPCRADATSQDTVRKSWFSTPPFDREILSKAAKLQLVTVSKDQGWCSNPSGGIWSWFEIAVLPAQGWGAKRDTEGEDLVWVSHGNPMAARDLSELDGVIFEGDHDIWKHLTEGDVIEVRACAKFSGWCNDAREGKLRVWEFFEPTLPPRTD